jgi:hypothetical protein
MKDFKITDFRFASINDSYNELYMDESSWSRLYEYKYVFNTINSKKNNFPNIHNTSWGYCGIHITFRDELDKIGNCLHSDIQKSTIRTSYLYDITEEHKEFEEKFDFVINISTIEHIKSPEKRIIAIENLFKQVKIGGYLILTFDYPRVNLLEIENLLNYKCEDTPNKLNGNNSLIKNEKYKDLNIIYLTINKIK